MERVLGKDLSVYRAIAISLGQSKNDNRDNVKSRFVALTLKDEESIGASKIGHILFEDEIGSEAFEELMQCRLLDENNKPKIDQHNGYIVDKILAKKRSAERKAQDEENRDELGIDKMLIWKGGITLPYRFPTGPRYANDAAGNQILDKDKNPVIKSEIEVFVQVKEVVYKDDGTKEYTFYPGMSLNARGERLMRAFYKKAASTGSSNVIEERESAATPEPASIEGPGF